MFIPRKTTDARASKLVRAAFPSLQQRCISKPSLDALRDSAPHRTFTKHSPFKPVQTISFDSGHANIEYLHTYSPHTHAPPSCALLTWLAGRGCSVGNYVMMRKYFGISGLKTSSLMHIAPNSLTLPVRDVFRF